MHEIRRALQRANQEGRTARGGNPPDFGMAQNRPRPNAAAGTTRKVECDIETWRRNLVLASSEERGPWAAYRTLRTQVLQRLQDEGQRVLGITSPSESSGKTLTAVNLAISLARSSGRTVLLVDLDLRRPSVHRRLGWDPSLGLDDYFAGRAELADVIVNPGIDSLNVLPTRLPIEGSSELLASAEMGQFIVELRNRYADRLIVVDLPPVLQSDDVLAFSAHVEACLLVLEAGKTRKEQIVRSVELLRRTRIIGTVLNNSRERMVGYY
jgi:capsular exopolysaccharide synthesis family protein